MPAHFLWRSRLFAFAARASDIHRSHTDRLNRPGWASIHATGIIRSLERDVFPTISDLPIAQLTPPIILAVLREIEARGAIETANRVRPRISAVFVYGIAKGIVQADPAEKLGKVLKPLRKGRRSQSVPLNQNR